MHYVLLTYGSMGDIRPFVALATGLQKKGHRVTLAAPENFKSFIESFDIPFYSLPGNMEERVNTPPVLKMIQSRDNLSFLLRLLKVADELRPALFQKMLDISRDADVLITSTLGIFFVDVIAQYLKKPWAMLLPSPPMIETAQYPFPDFDGLNFPAWNRLTYRLVTFAFWQAYKSRINEARASLGLANRSSNPLRAFLKEKVPTLFLFTPLLIPRPSDWPDSCRITGFLTLDEPQLPDTHLATWLQSGDRPIYIGFGSIPIPKPRQITAIIEAILQSTNHRVIFCKGWALLPELPRHPNLLVIERADHRWLLPQCLTAIHHGGAGTIAAALTAKIPSIVLSLFGDQVQWGKIVQRKGIGVHIPLRKAKPAKILRAIEKVTTPPIAQQAAAIGEQVQKENGVDTAVETLAEFFKRHKAP